jgi:chromosome segregation ATPase
MPDTAKKAAPSGPDGMWFQGGFAALVQTDSFLSVSVDYSNITKVLAIVGEAVKETKTFEKVIATQQKDFKELLKKEQEQTSALEKNMKLVLSRSEEQTKQLDTLRGDFTSTTGKLEKRVAALERSIYGAAAVSGATDAQAKVDERKDLGNMEGLGLRKYAQDNYETIHKMQTQVKTLEEMESALDTKVSANRDSIKGLKVEIADVIKCPIATELSVLDQLLGLGKTAQEAYAAPLKGWTAAVRQVRPYNEGMPAADCKRSVSSLHHIASEVRDVAAPLIAECHSVIADAATCALRVQQLLEQQQQPADDKKASEELLQAKQAVLEKLAKSKAATDMATLDLGRALHEVWKTYNEAPEVDTAGALAEALEAALKELIKTVETHSGSIEALERRVQSNSEEITRLRETIEKAGGVEIVDQKARARLEDQAEQLAKLILELEKKSEGGVDCTADVDELRKQMAELEAKITAMVKDVAATCAAKADLAALRAMVEAMGSSGDSQDNSSNDELQGFIGRFRKEVEKLWTGEGQLNAQDQTLHRKLLLVEGQLAELLRQITESSTFNSSGERAVDVCGRCMCARMPCDKLTTLTNNNNQDVSSTSSPLSPIITTKTYPRCSLSPFA